MSDKHERLETPGIGIVGYGFVGKAMHHIFPEAIIYDKYLDTHSLNQDKVKKCDIVFVCVPTDMRDNGEANLEAIEETFQWLVNPHTIIVIKSTVPPGTTDYLKEQYNTNKVIFNPEFLAERSWKKDVENENRIVLGGPKEYCRAVTRAYQTIYDHSVSYLYTDAKTAELVKYVNNAFFATKVAFSNQVFDICNALDVDYDELREIWLHEQRITRSHTQITKLRGFGGYCLPKDLAALVKTAQASGYDPALLRAVFNYNCKVRKEFKNKELN